MTKSLTPGSELSSFCGVGLKAVGKGNLGGQIGAVIQAGTKGSLSVIITGFEFLPFLDHSSFSSSSSVLPSLEAHFNLNGTWPLSAAGSLSAS